MNRRQLKVPSPALIISLVALFVALGGTTYAAVSLPAHSVGTKQLKNRAVNAAKINPNGLAKAPTTLADNPHTSTDPCLLSTPQAGIFCGTSSAFWAGGAFAADRVQFWRDLVGVVHISGEARSSSGFTAGGSSVLFYLPPAYRPRVVLAFPVATHAGAGASAAGSGMLVIYPANFSTASVRGAVALYSAGVAGHEVVIGDVQFRTH
jgi:hypothetical protein